MEDSNTNVPTSPVTRGGGRGRGRGRRNSETSNGPYNPHRGRGRGRGRGGRGRGRDGDQGNNFEASLGRPPGGSFGARLTEAAPQEQGDSQNPQTAEMQPLERRQSIGTEDSEVCFICASPIEHLSVAPCNHQTCHICSLRLRALYKTRACAHCRVSKRLPVEWYAC